jgi:hypothetical protein
VLLTGLLVFAVLATTDRIAAFAFAGISIGLVLALIQARCWAQEHTPRCSPAVSLWTLKSRRRQLTQRDDIRAAHLVH